MDPLKLFRCLNELYYWWEILGEMGALRIHLYTTISDRMFGRK